MQIWFIILIIYFTVQTWKKTCQLFAECTASQLLFEVTNDVPFKVPTDTSILDEMKTQNLIITDFVCNEKETGKSLLVPEENLNLLLSSVEDVAENNSSGSTSRRNTNKE